MVLGFSFSINGNNMRELSIGILLACVVWTITLNISAKINKRMDILGRSMRIMYFANLVNLLALIPANYTRGIEQYRIVTWITTCISYVAVLILLFVLHTMVCEVIFEKVDRNKIILYIPAVIYAILSVLYFISYFYHIFYYIDGAGEFQHTSYYYFCQLYAIVAIVDAIVGAYYSFRGNSKLGYVYCIYIIIVVLFFPFQFVTHNSAPFNLGLTAGLHYLFVYAYYQREEETRRQREEISEIQTRLMISQIQPHFVFNSLSSIMVLCKKDPNRAASAIADFSDFLRENIDSITNKEPISFERELRHIQTYVELEKLRFKEKIKCEFEINYVNFQLPALTIQPLVENAIKHGVSKKKDGGVVKITTERIDGKVVITVADNGVGFDISKIDEENVNHAGINNVRRRIEYYKGEFDIKSEIGIGSQATVVINDV